MTIDHAILVNNWFAIDGYEVALAITFDRGTGTTCSVGPHQVRFRTAAKLDVGDELVGTIALSNEHNPPGVLWYRARILRVELNRCATTFEVEANFEHFELSMC
jgi:hypothetical protein